MEESFANHAQVEFFAQLGLCPVRDDDVACVYLANAVRPLICYFDTMLVLNEVNDRRVRQKSRIGNFE